MFQRRLPYLWAFYKLLFSTIKQRLVVKKKQLISSEMGSSTFSNIRPNFKGYKGILEKNVSSTTLSFTKFLPPYSTF